MARSPSTRIPRRRLLAVVAAILLVAVIAVPVLAGPAYRESAGAFVIDPRLPLGLLGAGLALIGLAWILEIAGEDV